MCARIHAQRQKQTFKTKPQLKQKHISKCHCDDYNILIILPNSSNKIHSCAVDFEALLC